ncbi:putative protein of unknown function DUF1741 protein [Neofusicoccum parvum UCRNP2]|uniref:Uncharacterized protein n=2 Tax=Neofusicoccum parvum TaxID=310453 RepID=R1GL23_BOTPV|nr:putative protein of unknown function DUF1741 protein [Neofusicoccum parvum UCRNP2]GME24181.1 hypothetical protein GTA08_BOTSDO06029 [Neofusicoccum parvum]
MPRHSPREPGNPDGDAVVRSDSTAPRPSSSRLLFVEVRGPRGKRRQGLQYDRSTRELKSHVMRVSSADRRKRQAGAGSVEDGDARAERASVAVTPASWLPAEVSAQHIDPFDVLPVKVTPELHTAMRYYFEHYPGPTPLTDDSLVCSPNAYAREKMQWTRVQFSFVQDQYHMLLFIWRIMKNMSKDMDFQALTVWAEVLELTRREMPIGKTGLDIPESYVALLGGLAVAETWMGNFGNSKQHRDAMLELVGARGGLGTFSPLAQRAVKWCEFYACAAQALHPGLPRLRVLRLPADLVRAAAAAHRRSMALLPPPLAQSQLSVILFQLHAVTLGQLTSPHSPLATVMDDLEHRILDEMAARRERAAALPPSTDPMDAVYGALLQTTQICVFRTMTFARKEMPLDELNIT